MADMLTTGVSGLLAFQKSLDTTSNNISNVNTPGYSRERADLVTRQAEPASNGWIGNGVDVGTVTRLYNDYIATQVRTASSAFQQLDTFATQANDVNNLLGDSTTGLSATLQNFANSVQAVANTPASSPARQTLLSQAQSLVQRFQTYDDSLTNTDAQINSQVSGEVTTVTSLAQNIAKLNQQIATGYAQTGQPPNDLLDQRDTLIDQLATHINVSTVKQNDGQVNIFVGNGQSLVVGNTSAQLVASTDSFDPTRLGVAIKSAGGSIDITGNLSGGTLGGVLSFRTQVLDPARNTLGQLSVALTSAVNTQNKSGIDLNGALGQDVFSVGGVQVLPNVNNAAAASVAATRTDVGSLTTADYVLTQTSGGLVLTRADTGATITTSGAGTALSPLTADGLSIVVSGAPATGDRFLIQPTRTAVSGLNVVLTDPGKIAAAAPIVAQQDASNIGNATITQGQVLDPTNAQLRTTATILFQDATHYTVNGGPSQTYVSGGNIDANGWRVQIAGTPAANDQFTVSDNTTGVGDNRNALLLAAAINQPLLNNGKTSLGDAIGQFLGNIGVQTNQAQANSSAQQVIYNDAVNSQQSVSGVNLDEEAGSLLRFQQAYQAAAQVIKIADTLFQSVLDATRS